MPPPPPKDGDFWNLDLARLTLSGCLLMLAAIAFIFGAMMLVFFLAPPDWRERRWMKLVLIPIIGLGALLFALARKWLDSIGWPILRPVKGKGPPPLPPRR
jgi:hypothetical protein